MHKLALTLTTAIAAIGLPATPAAAEPAPLPVDYSVVGASAYATLHTNGPPPGANDWDCEPSAEHPNPVVLTHGTIENMAFNWHALSPLLKNNGYCVFALNYGQEDGVPRVGFPGSVPPGGTGPIVESAAELDTFVDRVLDETDADKVDIVGHSQGGMLPRYYLKNLGGAEHVGKLIGMSPSNHGTAVFGLARLPGSRQLLEGALGAVGVAFPQQFTDSEFIADLNAGGDTVPGVAYSVIQTRFDEVVTPYTSAFLDGPDVRNILVQDGCALDASDHIAISFSRRALTHVLNELDPEHAVVPPCVPVLPALGG